MVSQIFYQNGIDAYPSITADYRDVKCRVQNKGDGEVSIFTALEVLPTVRRVSSLPEKLSNGDTTSAMGLASLALINAPEDWRDVKSAYGQIRSKIDKTYNYDPLYNRKTHQHNFAFLRGTAIEKWLHKQKANGNPFAKKVYEMDRYTVADTKCGKAVQKFFGVETVDIKEVDKIQDAAGVKARAFKFKSRRLGGEITTRAMKRIPVLSVIALGLIELPRILKAFSKGDNAVEHAKNGVKQTVKSSVNVTAIATGIAGYGAIGAKYGGACGSLAGMGFGAVLASAISNKLQQSIP